MNIETHEVKEEIGMFITFWGKVITLKQISSGRVFSKYLIKSKEVSIMSDDWEIGTHTFSESKQVRIKKGTTIDKVTDELGNIYFEITDMILK